MTQSDLNLLLEMGFDKDRAELAVKKNGGLQGALQWLEDNQDKSLEELQAAGKGAGKDADDEDAEAAGPSVAAVEDGQTAKSLVCNECGKKFRNHAQAEFHASKTEHTDFSESVEEVAPLTETEKAAKLAQLREKLQEKKAAQALADKELAKQNEKIRMKSTKETQDLKEQAKLKETAREAAKKRQEKLDDIEAKRRIKAKIEADKEERRRKAEEAKAAREGRPLPSAGTAVDSAPATAAAAAASSAPKAAATHSEARLRLQTAKGNIQKTFPAETTLFEVAQAIEEENGGPVTSFTMTFPRKVLEGHVDFGKTLKEAGLVPSAVLIVK